MRDGWKEKFAKGFSRSVFAVGLSVAVSGLLLPKLQAKTLKDILGNEITVPDNPKRVLLGEGRLIYAMEPLEGDHLFDRIAGWQGEFKQADTQTYAVLKKRFPKIDKIQVIGKTTAESVNPEKVLELNPDLVILSTSGHGPGQADPLVAKLKKVHIPVLFVDFRHDPITNTVPSMTILGKALNREKEAKKFTDFYQNRLNLIQSRLKNLSEDNQPSVFLYMAAGAKPCCHTAGKGNMGRFVSVAGGKNIAAPLLLGDFGELSIEQVIAANPDFLIMDGTRGPMAEGPGLRMGALAMSKEARQSLSDLASTPSIATLNAAKERHLFGIWHSYYDNPFNILAVEAFAKWFHPDIFTDLDPDADLKKVQKEFTQTGIGGTYWTSLSDPVFPSATSKKTQQ